MEDNINEKLQTARNAFSRGSATYRLAAIEALTLALDKAREAQDHRLSAGLLVAVHGLLDYADLLLAADLAAAPTPTDSIQ
jgi:hypothetical protein